MIPYGKKSTRKYTKKRPVPEICKFGGTYKSYFSHFLSVQNIIDCLKQK